MILTIAWRNVWRHKLRSAVVVMAIAAGLTGGLFAVAFARGFVEQLVNQAIDTENAHLEIVAAQAPDTERPGMVGAGVVTLVPEADELARELRGMEGILQAAPRLSVQAMLASAHGSTSLVLNGIDPEAEKGLTSLHSFIPEGSGAYFDGSQGSPVLIGSRLARALGVGLGDRLVATFQDAHGGVASTVFRVAGIFHVENTSYERRHAFVLREELSQWMGLDGPGATSVGIRLVGGLSAAEGMRQELTVGRPFQVITWMDMRPEMAFFFGYIGLLNTLILGVILLALSLGVVNTMLMTVSERRTELGVLRAIGMKNHQVVQMMVLETLFLLLVGSAFSLLLGGALVAWLGETGIDLSAYAKDYTSPTRDYQSIVTTVTRVYPVFAPAEFVRLSVLVVVTGLLAAWLPAKQALKTNPAEAVKMVL